MPICPSCGEDNPERARYCLACASPLAPPPAGSREVRKIVTVLFSDVTGSTSLGEQHDPESVRRFMGRYFDAMRLVLERHGGVVEKFIGDAVMAVFGIPTLHEDDALRAVRAAQEMQEVLRRLNAELERDYGVSIRTRTGVNSGEVVSGDPSAGQTLVTGDTVNTAARLQQAASSGEILLGEVTYRLVRDAVRVEPVEPLSLRGKAEPVPAYRLLEVLPGADAHARRLDSPMVGRDRELSMLLEAFDRALQERSCRLVTILGQAGIGKSRLVQEFLSQTEGRAQVLRGLCLPYGEGITYWPVSEVVKEAADITGADSPEVAVAKIASLLEEEREASLIAQRVAALIGLAEASAHQAEAFRAVRELFDALARKRPLVVLMEDIHWAEPTLLDLIEYLALGARDAPFILLCAARPELLERRPDWQRGVPQAPALVLEPLTEEESQRLIRNLLGQADLAAEATRRITEAAEGNPLFVEEMFSMLIDDGLLRRNDGNWVPTSDLSKISVPPTIQALLAARLDRLPSEERAVLERASVVGKVFYWGAVADLSLEHARSGVGTHLMALVRKDFIHPGSSEFAGEDTFRFRHILIRDAAYQGMPKGTRGELHERVADWLGRKVGDRAVEYEEILGYHLEQAYRLRAELGPVDEEGRSLAARAAQRLAMAGRRALTREDMPAAVNLLSRAVDLLPTEDPSRLQILPDLGEALMVAGEFRRSEAVLTQAIEAAARWGDTRLHGHVLIARLMGQLFADREGWPEEARGEAERMIPVFEQLGDEVGLAQAWRLLGESYLVLGQVRAAEDAAQRAITHARRAGDSGQEVTNLGFFAQSGALGPTPVPDAIRRCNEVLEHVKGYFGVEAWVLRHLASLHAMWGRFDEARASIARARAVHEQFGQRFWLAGGLPQSSGYVEMLADDPLAAERELRFGYEILERIGEKHHLSMVSGMLAQATYAQGRYEAALEFTKVSERAAASKNVDPQIRWREVRAKVLAKQGKLDEAEKLAREAVKLAAQTDFLDLYGSALMDLAEVLRMADRSAEAKLPVSEAQMLFRQKGNLVSARRAHSCLGKTAV